MPIRWPATRMKIPDLHYRTLGPVIHIISGVSKTVNEILFPGQVSRGESNLGRIHCFDFQLNSACPSCNEVVDHAADGSRDETHHSVEYRQHDE